MADAAWERVLLQRKPNGSLRHVHVNEKRALLVPPFLRPSFLPFAVVVKKSASLHSVKNYVAARTEAKSPNAPAFAVVGSTRSVEKPEARYAIAAGTTCLAIEIADLLFRKASLETFRCRPTPLPEKTSHAPFVCAPSIVHAGTRLADVLERPTHANNLHHVRIRLALLHSSFNVPLKMTGASKKKRSFVEHRITTTKLPIMPTPCRHSIRI